MRCKYSISEYRINQLHNGLYYPACPFSKRLRCSRVYTDAPFCPLKNYDLEKIPPIIYLENVACEFRKRGRRSRYSIPCAFDSEKFCGMKGNGPCPFISLEQLINAAHDKMIAELWGEVDDWISTVMSREKAKVKRKEGRWKLPLPRKERVRHGI